MCEVSKTSVYIHQNFKQSLYGVWKKRDIPRKYIRDTDDRLVIINITHIIWLKDNDVQMDYKEVKTIYNGKSKEDPVYSSVASIRRIYNGDKINDTDFFKPNLIKSNCKSKLNFDAIFRRVLKISGPGYSGVQDLINDVLLSGGSSVDKLNFKIYLSELLEDYEHSYKITNSPKKYELSEISFNWRNYILEQEFELIKGSTFDLYGYMEISGNSIGFQQETLYKINGFYHPTRNNHNRGDGYFNYLIKGHATKEGAFTLPGGEEIQEEDLTFTYVNHQIKITGVNSFGSFQIHLNLNIEGDLGCLETSNSRITTFKGIKFYYRSKLDCLKVLLKNANSQIEEYKREEENKKRKYEQQVQCLQSMEKSICLTSQGRNSKLSKKDNHS